MLFVPRAALAAIAIALFTPLAASAEPVLHVYGPGGPSPAMKDAAQQFSVKHHVSVEVVSGPTPAWRDKALHDADVIYSGSENMMTDFISQLPLIDTATVRPMYLRPAAILVHPGNPLKITGLSSLLKPGVRVIVVQGAGQTGMWEDIAGRLGDLNTLRALRSNIVSFAPNSAAALQEWTKPDAADAWIIYNIWQIAHPAVAQIVPIEPQYAIWRDAGVALTQRGDSEPLAHEFYDFLMSSEGAAIFSRWGWK
ncbi:MAG: AcfC family putative adhesin [Candidatus Velthaea sp.]